jgi:hypothetical protein
MANYNSPFATYTPRNPAETAALGFQTGLNIRRNIEETAKLVREREEHEASQLAIQKAFKKRQEVDAGAAMNEADFTDKADRADAGYDVSDTDLKYSFKKLMDSGPARAKRYAEIADELIGSGYKEAIEVGMKLAQESQVMAAGLAAHAHNMETAANTRRGQDVTAGTQVATQAMGDAARLQQQEASDAAAMARQQAGDAAAGERNQAQIASNEKIHGKSPLSLMKERIETISALQGAGIPDTKIDAMLADIGPGLTTADLRDQWQGMSDELRAQVKEVESDIKRLQDRAEAGDDVGDLISSAIEEQGQLRKQADEIMASKYRQSAYRRNTPLAVRTIHSFAEGLETVSHLPYDTPSEVAAGGGLPRPSSDDEKAKLNAGISFMLRSVFGGGVVAKRLDQDSAAVPSETKGDY